MRRFMAVCLMVVIGAILASGLNTAGAQPVETCLTVSVTAPIVGTKEQTRCPVTLPNPPFTHHFVVTNCRGVPPIGFTACVEVSTWIP